MLILRNQPHIIANTPLRYYLAYSCLPSFTRSAVLEDPQFFEACTAKYFHAQLDVYTVLHYRVDESWKSRSHGEYPKTLMDRLKVECDNTRRTGPFSEGIEGAYANVVVSVDGMMKSIEQDLKKEGA